MIGVNRACVLPKRVASLAVAGLLAALIGCERDVPVEPPPEPQPVAVAPTDVHKVGVERIESGPVVSGTLAPIRDAVISARA